MYPYLIYFSILLFLAILCFLSSSKKYSRTIRSIAFLVAMICIYSISALKSYSVGTDTITYERIYVEFGDNSAPFFQNKSKYDFNYGFYIIFNLFARNGISFRAFLSFVYLLIYAPVGIVLFKCSKQPVFSLILFCLWSFMVFNFSGLRQGISNSICFLALLFLKKEKSIKKEVFNLLFFSFLILIAYSFHKSAISFFICLPIVVLFRKPNSLISLSFLPCVIYFLAPSIYQFFYYKTSLNYYIPTSISDAGGLFVFYYLIFFAGLLFLPTQKISLVTNALFCGFREKTLRYSNENHAKTQNDKTKVSNVALIAIFVVGVCIEAFSHVCSSMTRLSLPFLMPATIFIPNIISLQRSNILKFFGYLICLIAFAAVFIFDFIDINYLNFMPYSFL